MGAAKTQKGKGASEPPTKRKVTHAKASGSDAQRDVSKDLATKKKQVRELAHAGDWEQIKRLYGGKMVAKAKAYIEKNGSSESASVTTVALCRSSARREPPQPISEPEKVTPQMLAKQILARNGYDTSTKGIRENGVHKASMTARRIPDTRLQHADPRLKTPTQTSPPLDRTSIAPIHSVVAANTYPKPTASLTPPKRGGLDGARSKQAPIVIQDSPEELTADQKRRIEERRRQALEKRKRHAPVPAATHTPVISQLVEFPMKAHQENLQTKSHANRSYGRTHEVPSRVMPIGGFGRAPNPFQSAHVELEVAAQITDWDLEEPRTSDHPRLVTPPSAKSVQDTRNQSKYGKPKEWTHTTQATMRYATKNPPVAAQGRQNRNLESTTTISQELAVAAEIPWWDFEDCAQEDQIQPDRASNQVEKKQQRSYPIDISIQQAESESNPTRLDISSEPAISDVDGKIKLDGFIARHFLDDKFDETVLDFVNMMLA